MMMPTNILEFQNYWISFTAAVSRAKKLEAIELYGCPPHVVEGTISSLSQLAVLNATIRGYFLQQDSKLYMFYIISCFYFLA